MSQTNLCESSAAAFLCISLNVEDSADSVALSKQTQRVFSVRRSVLVTAITKGCHKDVEGHSHHHALFKSSPTYRHVNEDLNKEPSHYRPTVPP